MPIRLLWPVTRWPDNHEMEQEAAGEGVECVFSSNLARVTDEQWASAHGLVSSLDPLAPNEMEKLEQCRIVITPKVGFDNFDLKKWGDFGIPVCNVPDYGTEDVADHAMGLVLSLMKGIARYNDRLKKDPHNGWQPLNQPLAKRLSLVKIGIVGLGRIGTAMTLRAKAFGMEVTFFDPYKPNGSGLALGIKRADTLEELFSHSDLISLHVPLTAETRNLVNATILSHAQRGLVLVNVARGEVVDIEALHDSMRSGQIAGAGLDVLPEEPLNLDRPLIQAWQNEEPWIQNRLLLTPHSAFYTPQSLYDMRVNGIHVAKKYLTTGKLENCVNEEFLAFRK